MRMNTHTWWYVSRASGIVLWVLVVAAVGWGFAVSARLVRRRGLPAWMQDLHKHLGTLTVVFTVVHLAALWADSYSTFGWAEFLVPMASKWRPGAVAWGVVAMYLLAIVQGTSWAMRRLPRKVWHATHLLSLPMLVLGTLHGVLAGTDAKGSRVVVLLGAAGMIVVTMASLRMTRPTTRRAAPTASTEDRLAAIRARASRVPG